MSDNQAEYLIDVIRARIPIPLPHVPTGATCGGCRWWALNANYKPTEDFGTCYLEPETANRYESNPACRHYEGAKK